tara:strand:- start:3493 stop:4323 length:831 start_codon:yes stop_codon:yes gene_type:complete
MITCENFNSENYGRFGNQIFQYSICKILSKIHDTNFHLNPSRHFANFFDNSLTYKPFDFIHQQNQKYIEDNPFEFDENLLSHNNIDIAGFFQNIKYYKNFTQIINKELKPNNKILNNARSYLKIKSQNCRLDKILTIHVRRRDYTNYKHIYNFISIKNYLKIIKNFNYDYLFIVSDDINSVKQEVMDLKLLLKNTIFVDDLDVYHQFYIIYLANMNVLSNSTFCWWSAYLSSMNTKKNIYAPDPWVNNNKVNLYPPDWHKFSCNLFKWEQLFYKDS